MFSARTVFNVEELFKFSAVADRFVCKYVKKVLIASEEVTYPALRHRVGDMGIRLIDHVCVMFEEWFVKMINYIYNY